MANDDVTTQGPLGSPAGQMLQRGMNFMFGKPKQPMGMVAPVAQQAVKPAPPTIPSVSPNIAPTMDLNSPNNVMTTVERMERGY